MRCRLLALLVCLGVCPGVVWADEAYAGKELNVTFRYPSGWLLTQEAGTIESYQAVRVSGPKNSGQTYRATIVIRRRSLDEAVDLQTWLDRLPSGATVVERTSTSVGAAPAQQAVADYAIPAMHRHGMSISPIRVRERHLIVERAPYRYELTYSADQDEYVAFSSQFELLLASFAFR